ncbi:MAG: glycosyltransferase family 2 protein [Pyrinomonadaceae bacterium]
MDRKLFSVIIPVFESGPKIEKTVRSVLSQDENLFELIVMDGGSTDDTLSAVEKYAGRIKLVSESDGGVYHAMNKGVELAGGKYLYFLGAGDSLREGVLAKVAGRLPAGDLALVYGNVYMVDRGLVYDGAFDTAKLRKRNISHQSIFYERSIFDVMGGYEPRFKVLADHAFNLKCFWNNRIRKEYIAYVVANFEGGGVSDSEIDLDFAQEYAELMSIGEA